MSYHIYEREGALQQETLGSTSQEDLMSDHGGAQHLPVTPQTKQAFISNITDYDVIYLTANTMLHHLRAMRPSTPSSGPGESLDRAWETKRRGTAHQCLEPSCWISCSNTGPKSEHNSERQTGFLAMRSEPEFCLCTSVFWWQAVEEVGHKNLKFSCQLGAISNTLASCPEYKEKLS